VNGALLGEFHGPAVGAVGHREKMEGLPECGVGQEVKKLGFLDHIRAPEKPVAGPPGPFNPEASPSQPLDLFPDSGAGHAEPSSDFLSGNKPSFALLEHPSEQIPHSSPVRETCLETFILFSLPRTGKSIERNHYRSQIMSLLSMRATSLQSIRPGISIHAGHYIGKKTGGHLEHFSPYCKQTDR
jgi:hypothetical protein